MLSEPRFQPTFRSPLEGHVFRGNLLRAGPQPPKDSKAQRLARMWRAWDLVLGWWEYKLENKIAAP